MTAAYNNTPTSPLSSPRTTSKTHITLTTIPYHTIVHYTFTMQDI